MPSEPNRHVIAPRLIAGRALAGVVIAGLVVVATPALAGRGTAAATTDGARSADAAQAADAAHVADAGQAADAVARVAHTVFGTDWPVYHHDGPGSGADPTGTDLSPAAPAWTSVGLDGQIYGEPLVEAGRVLVATENDTVYELAADTGAVLWATHIGTPVPSSDLPCGDISPSVGITGTPVVDPARGEVFAVTDELTGATGAQHYLTGIDLYTGAVLVHQPISLPGSSQLAQLQRTGLALDAGRVIAGFGGNLGDCSTYHGWITAIPEGGGAQASFEVAAAPGDLQGAVWMGGAAPEVDAAGNIWFATGNSAITTSGHPYDDGDGVLELSPSLVMEQGFAPSTWPSDNASDLDLGSGAPALLGNGLAFQAGKSHVGYLLSQGDLGGVGGELRDLASFCSGNVDGGNAVSGSTVYVPCQAGVVAVSTAPPTTATVLWRTSTGAGGPPIAAGGLVWTIAPGSGTLLGLDPSTGNSVQSFALGAEANHFPTPTVADGLLLAPSAMQVHAFAGPGGLPPPPSPPPSRPGYWTAAADGGVFTFGNAGFFGSLGTIHLAKPIVGMVATPDGRGYWLVASDGGVFAFGDAGFFGSLGHVRLTKPIVGMASAPGGNGYWLVASDGGVFAFGATGFFGSMGGARLAKPVVGMASTPDGQGYWLVASDGGVFAFGDARFAGSMGGVHLAKPVVAAAAAPGGYWLVASDGGVFAFGGAGYFGSTGNLRLVQPVVAMIPTSAGHGYWLVASDGGVFAFGDATFEGSVAGTRLAAPMVAVAAPPLP